MITIEQVARENVPAWVECEECKSFHWWCMLCEDWIHPNNVGYEEVHAIDSCRGECVPFNPDCKSCNGAGDKWHEAVSGNMPDPDCSDMRIKPWVLVANVDGKYVTRTSILTRTHQVCPRCYGSKEVLNFGKEEITEVPCESCLKDSAGKPTGAEPGTASEWEVK